MYFVLKALSSHIFKETKQAVLVFCY